MCTWLRVPTERSRFEAVCTLVQMQGGTDTRDGPPVHIDYVGQLSGAATANDESTAKSKRSSAKGSKAAKAGPSAATKGRTKTASSESRLGGNGSAAAMAHQATGMADTPCGDTPQQLALCTEDGSVNLCLSTLARLFEQNPKSLQSFVCRSYESLK